MQKLSKADIKRRDELAQAIRDSAADLESGFNEMIGAIQKFNAAIDTHNGLLNDAREWRFDIANAIDEFMNGKSDKWLEGERGEAFSQWKSEIEEMMIDDLEPIEEPEQPEAETAADNLDQMQEEPYS